MTKAAASSTERARRKELVTLSVISASAVTLAGSWLGIAAADGARAATTWSLPVPVEAVSASAPAPALEGGALQPVPPATRQVVVVRRSRAS